MKITFGSFIGAAMLLAAGSLQAAVVTNVFDDFNRADSDTLGTTVIGGYTWIENEDVAGRISISGNQASSGSGSFGQAALVDVVITNLIISADISFPVSGNYAAGIMYRVAPTNSQFFNGPSSTGYRVTFNEFSFSGPPRTASSILLEYGAYGDQILAAYTSPTAFQANTTYNLKVIAEGSAHTIYLDGVPIIAYSDPNLAHLNGGAVGLGAFQSGSYSLDNFLVTTIPEPGTALMLVAGGLLLWRRGR